MYNVRAYLRRMFSYMFVLHVHCTCMRPFMSWPGDWRGETSISLLVVELQRLQQDDSGRGRGLDDELRALRQHNNELQLKLSRLQQQHTDDDDGDVSRGELDALRARLAKLQSEKMAWTRRESDYNSDIAALRAQHSELTQLVASSEHAQSTLRTRLNEALAELSRLKKTLAARDRDKENFKEFVQLKRELAQLQDENARLRAKASSSSSAAAKKSKSSPAVAVATAEHLPSLATTSGANATTTYKRINSASRVRPVPSYATLTSG